VSSLLAWVSLTLLVASCASSQYPDIDEPMPPGVNTSMDSPALPDPSLAPAVTQAPGTLARGDVERVVDGGLGRFLSHVQLEPNLSGGKFAGWRIVALQPPELWNGIDLRPGDIVTRVNGMSIEREMEAYDAFQAVRGAEKLEVSYLRQREPRTLSYVIVGKPSPAIPAAPAPKPGG
jgi:S1-C subfamily serine protease